MSTLSECVAEFVTGLKFNQLPSFVVSTAKELVLDHLGVAAFGATTVWGRIVADTVRPSGGKQESSIYFTDDKLPAANAALVNGTFAHGFELDDHYLGAHSGCVVIPAAIAMGEREAADGRTLITAIVSGYEILARLAMTMRHISDRGHHTTGTLGPFGSVVAAGKLLGLDAKRFVSAIGIAGNFPSGVCEFYRGTMEKRVFAGRASESGILAALLAQGGLTGAKTIFEGKVGFCHAFSDDVDLRKLSDGLGKKFHTDKVFLKRYPCAGTNHPHIDAALSLYEKHGDVLSRRENVREILIEGGKRYRGKDILNPRRTALDIGGVMAAQYSIPYAVIVTLCRGRPGVEDFSEQALRDQAVRSLLRRCKVVKHDRFSGMGKITVRFRDGGVISAPVIDTNLPISKTTKEAVVNKFLDLTSSVFTREQAEKVIETIDRLEHLRDVRRLTEMIVSERLGSKKEPIAAARAGGRVY